MDLKTTLSLETGQFDSGLSSAISSVNKLDKQARLASKGLGEFFSQANTQQMRQSFASVDQVLKNLERTVSASGGNMKRDLRAMTLAATELEKTWRNLSSAEKSTAAGQELRSHIDQLIAQAGNLKDTMGDVQAVINLQASDTKNFDILAQGLTTVSAGFQVATGAASLFGISEEKISKVQKDLIAVMAITNGLQTIANALNKNSVLMTTLRATKEKILAAAILAKNAATTVDNKLTTTNTAGQVANTAATVIATTAKKAWNVATAVSKALLGDFTGLILVGAVALGTYALATSNSTDEIKKQNKATEDAAKFQNEYNNSVAQTTAQLISKYRELQIQWESLKTTGEKTQWIKNNATEFANLGLKVTDLKSAEDVFVNNTNNMVAALEARARAMAAQNMLVKAYEKYYQDNMNADNTVSGGGYYRRAKVGDTVDREEGKRSGIYNSNRSGYSNFRIQNQEEADKVNQQREAEARKRNTEAKEENTKQLKKSTDYLTKEIKVGNERAKKLGINVDTGKTTTTKTGSGRSGGSGSRSTGGGTTVEPIPEGSLADIKKQLSEKEKQLQLTPVVDTKKIAELKKQIKELKEKELDTEVILGIKVRFAVSKVNADDLKPQLDGLEVPEITDLKLPDFGNKFEELKKYQEGLVGIANAAQQTGQAFSQLGSAIGGQAGAVIGAFGEIAATIAQTIGQVISMMIAQGVGSAMSLPFPANLAAAATVIAGLASIISTIKSAASGSYAQGGIVPGNSLYGDKLIARVNSSEMILNTRQQKNLFRLLNGQSSVRGGGGSGQVEFKIKGSELYGVLRNYNDKKSKLV